MDSCSAIALTEARQGGPEKAIGGGHGVGRRVAGSVRKSRAVPSRQRSASGGVRVGSKGTVTAPSTVCQRPAGSGGA